MLRKVLRKISTLRRKHNYIKITKVFTKNKKLFIEYEVNGDVSKFFENNIPMEIDYGFSLNKIPKSILIIPFLSLFIPVAWITKSKIILDEIDLSYLEGLEKIRKSLNDMYGKNTFKRIKMKIRNTVKNDIKHENYSMFFSGGVDSLNTLCANYDKNPLLIMIWGSDIWLEDIKGWNTAKSNLDIISKTFNKKNICIKSNFRKTINELKLNEVYEKRLGDNWWHGVEHGLALLGHIAPIVFKYNVGTHFIPGTFSTKNVNVKCASYPTIDENFKVSNCRVIHDGFDYTRLDKVKNIVNFSKRRGINVKFRTCYKEREEKMNCCNCEKCYRTIMELVSIGENPQDYGYDYNEEIIKNTKSYLEKKEFEHVTSNFNWKQIKEEIMKNNYYKLYDLSWFKDIEL